LKEIHKGSNKNDCSINFPKVFESKSLEKEGEKNHFTRIIKIGKRKRGIIHLRNKSGCNCEPKRDKNTKYYNCCIL